MEKSTCQQNLKIMPYQTSVYFQNTTHTHAFSFFTWNENDNLKGGAWIKGKFITIIWSSDTTKVLFGQPKSALEV